MAESEKKMAQFVILTAIIQTIAIGVVFSQIPVHGVVRNVHTKKPIAGAKIKVLSTQNKFEANSEGYFYIPSQTIENNLNNGYFIASYPNIYWYYSNEISIEVYDVNGKLKYKINHKTNTGYFSVDALSNGIYLLKVEFNNSVQVHKLLKSSNTLAISKHIGHQNTQNNYTDTLIVTNDGYYDLEIPLSFSDHNIYGMLEVNMLGIENSNLIYFNELVNYQAFRMLCSAPAKTHLGEVESLKLLISRNNNLVYYINSITYDSHFEFAEDYLGYNRGHYQFNYEQYTDNPDRYLYPLTINYFKELDIFTFEFFSGDGANCSDVYWCYNQILESSFLKDNIFFYATNDSWTNCSDIKTITPNELFEGQNYQALNLAENYGYLRKIEVKAIEKSNLQRHDILLTNGLPIDIPVVAGIITAVFQTPLSHVNVLSHNRGTPNMALRDGFFNEKLNSLLDQLVYLKVTSDSFLVRSASIDEAATFWKNNEPSTNIMLDLDLGNYGLIDLDKASWADVNKIGGKAANFAELLNAFDNSNIIAPVPENYFAIPFYFYYWHLKNYGLDLFIDRMFENERFSTDRNFRMERLQTLQDSIIRTPVDINLLKLVNEKLNQDDRFTSYRFRSSTNAEDLEGFNGAGLYSSYTGRLNDFERSVELAIKKTWASLWNYTAFEEREYFKIDHKSCAMGILVHRSFPNEDANGVVLSKNPYNINHGYVVNVQFGEESIVNPEPGIIHDQVVIYTFSISGDEPYTLEYITNSNLPEMLSTHVLTNNELFELGDYIGLIKSYFYFNQIYNTQHSYNDFGLDIEFKIDSDIEPRKLYIKQVRAY